MNIIIYKDGVRKIKEWQEGICDPFNTHLFDMLTGEAKKEDLNRLRYCFPNRTKALHDFLTAPDPVTFFEERGLTVEEKE